MDVDDMISKQHLIEKIEETAFSLCRDIVQIPNILTQPRTSTTGIHIIKRTTSNSSYYSTSGNTKRIKLGEGKRIIRNIYVMNRIIIVLSRIHELILNSRKVSQRQLYYMVIHTEAFKDQNILNDTILDVSCMLYVPRYKLNITCATRAVIAGCINVCTDQSAVTDCRFVGTNGWPVPGDLNVIHELQLESLGCRYIIVIEKFGIFTTLIQNRIFDRLPCVLVCGKGYPCVAVRALTHILESTLTLPVVGIADYNPHGLALLQCYKHGSIRSSIEAQNYGMFYTFYIYKQKKNTQ